MELNADIVIFGGTGDLCLRKLMPALYRCENDAFFTKDLRIFIITRDLLTSGKNAKQLILEGLKTHLQENEFNENTWESFSYRLHYIQLDILQDGAQWSLLAHKLNTSRFSTRVFYFAIAAKLYGNCCSLLAKYNTLTPESRVVLEKPIGSDGKTAKEINAQVAEHVLENQIYRIDHYLGKEMVQNLLTLRFTNSVFESLWDNKSIDNVKIEIYETVGLEGRASYYDQAGALKDMIQNHLLQLFCLIAMEPPNQMSADEVRIEKLKVMRALRPMNDASVKKNTIRGQYTQGTIDQSDVDSYQEELEDSDNHTKTNKPSNTETYAAIHARVDNWRWAKVPFYFVTGKRMKERYAQITIQFKSVSHHVYPSHSKNIEANRLVIRLQPEEEMKLFLTSKEMDEMDMSLTPMALDLDFSCSEKNSEKNKPSPIRDAYKRLLIDIIKGDPTLFAHRDEIEQTWSWLDPITESWNKNIPIMEYYRAGSWGPSNAAILMRTPIQNPP